MPPLPDKLHQLHAAVGLGDMLLVAGFGAAKVITGIGAVVHNIVAHKVQPLSLYRGNLHGGRCQICNGLLGAERHLLKQKLFPFRGIHIIGCAVLVGTGGDNVAQRHACGTFNRLPDLLLGIAAAKIQTDDQGGVAFFVLQRQAIGVDVADHIGGKAGLLVTKTTQAHAHFLGGDVRPAKACHKGRLFLCRCGGRHTAGGTGITAAAGAKAKRHHSNKH